MKTLTVALLLIVITLLIAANSSKCHGKPVILEKTIDSCGNYSVIYYDPVCKRDYIKEGLTPAEVKQFFK